MKYKDDKHIESGEITVNSLYVGVRHASPLGDALSPGTDGYEHHRDTEHFGSVLQENGDKTIE